MGESVSRCDVMYRVVRRYEGVCGGVRGREGVAGVCGAVRGCEGVCGGPPRPPPLPLPLPLTLPQPLPLPPRLPLPLPLPPPPTPASTSAQGNASFAHTPSGLGVDWRLAGTFMALARGQQRPPVRVAWTPIAGQHSTCIGQFIDVEQSAQDVIAALDVAVRPLPPESPAALLVDQPLHSLSAQATVATAESWCPSAVPSPPGRTPPAPAL